MAPPSMLAPNTCRATAAVCVSGRVITEANSTSFQPRRKAKIPETTIAGPLSGKMIRARIWTLEAPSMRAASSSSRGSPRR